MTRFIGMLIVSLAAGEAPAPAVDALSLEDKVLSQRRSIVSGQIEYHSKEWEFPGGKRQLSYDVRTIIWFDDNNIRYDEYKPYKLGDERRYRSIRCLTPDTFFYWSDQELSPVGDHVMLEVQKRDAIPKKDPFYQMGHPRLLGTVPEPIPELLRNYHLESYLGRTDRTRPTVQHDQVGQRECWRIDYEVLNGTKVSLWMAPEWGFNPVRIETRSKLGGKQYHHKFEATYQRADEQHWYPQSCQYWHTIDNHRAKEATLEVNLLAFNHPPDAKIFELIGMGIPAGTTAHKFPEESSPGGLIWNGKELIPARQARESSQNMRVRLLALAGVLALVASVALVYFIKQKRRRVSA
jgi:hypothetical protein